MLMPNSSFSSLSCSGKKGLCLWASAQNMSADYNWDSSPLYIVPLGGNVFVHDVTCFTFFITDL